MTECRDLNSFWSDFAFATAWRTEGNAVLAEDDQEKY